MHFYSGHLNAKSKLYPRKCTKYIGSFSTPTFSSSSACWSHPSHLWAKVGYSQDQLCYRVCQPSTFEGPFPYTFYDLLKHMRYSHMSKHPTYPPIRVTFAGVYPSYPGVEVEFHPRQGKNLHSLLQASLSFWLGEAGVAGEHIETLREHGTLHSTGPGPGPGLTLKSLVVTQWCWPLNNCVRHLRAFHFNNKCIKRHCVILEKLSNVRPVWSHYT